MNLYNRVEKELLPFVTKPGRYTGNEYNVIKKNTSDVNLRVVLAFPELYELGMSYLGYDILYHILNSQKNIWAERVYAPWFDAEDVLREKKIPLFSLESRTPLNEFDWIGFTLQYELTYTTILNMINLANIPLRSKDRNDKWPLIIGGGPLACNPEPIADFFDAFLIGDGEKAVVDICQAVLEGKKNNWSKKQILRELGKIQGIYIPAFYDILYNQFGDFVSISKNDNSVSLPIKKAIVPKLEEQYYTLNPLVPLIEITHDRLSVEIMRGCTEGCRFCNAGMIYRPVRQRSVQGIMNQTQNGIKNSGFNEVSLLSLNTSDYDDLNWLMTKEKIFQDEANISFSFPSLRLDGLTPEMVDFAQHLKKTGFTFAPEAGSQRLRNVINKNIKDKDMFQTLDLVLKNDWKTVKFYFMVGLPTEKDEDIKAIINLVKNCLEIANDYKDVKFNLSISPFSPKSHTPFQWEKQNQPEELESKGRYIQDNLHYNNITVSWRDGLTSTLETIFARGGRELADVIEESWKDGARFDGWKEGFSWDRWESAFTKSHLNWQKYIKPLSVSVPLPWDHIDMGIMKDYLQNEKIRAYEGKVSHDCKDYVCLGCGLQRKEFENLVNCYKSQEVNRKEKNISQYSFTPDNKLNQSVSASFGRSSKRRKVGIPVVKKKIRIKYTKTGLTRYISHLDVIRVFDRAARRAKISVVYTQGFHPRPKIAFGPPLGLGIASIAEYLDMDVEINRESDIQFRLNEVLPEGMQVLEQRTIYKKVNSLASSINQLHYETFLEDFPLQSEWIEKWLAKNEVKVERIMKENNKIINIRPFVKNIKLTDNRVNIILEGSEGKMARISEVLNSILEPCNIDYRQFLTQRIGQYIAEGDQIQEPFDVL